MRRALPLFALALLTACQPDAPSTPDAGASDPYAVGTDEVTVYSGRKQVLVDALAETWPGGDAQIRYGSDAELLAALAEEGGRSPAGVFWANTAGALGAAVSQDLFAPLSQETLALADGYVPSSGLWAPLTVRFRVLAYNPGAIAERDLPASVLALPGVAALKGRIGWTPAYSSFQDFVTALRQTEGEAAARAWLGEMKAMEPKAYPSNTPMLEALMAGEIDVALTNHYYVLRMLEGDEANEADEAAPIATHHFAAGDIGNLALVTGAGVLKTAEDPAAAERFIAYLLSDAAQEAAAGAVNEYPVVRETPVPGALMPFDDAVRLSPTFDMEGLRDLDATLRLLRDEGLL